MCFLRIKPESRGGGIRDRIVFCLYRGELKGSHAPDRLYSAFLCPAAGYGKK